MTLSRFSVALALALALRPASAVAQAKCEIDEKKPNQVKDAATALVKVTLPIGKSADKIKSIMTAVTLLTKDQDKIVAVNAPGRAFVLGRALSLYAEEAMRAGRDSSLVVKRADVGFATEPEAMIDLVAAADTAFDIVEAANGACQADTEEWRRRLYAPLVNAAVNAYNAQQYDSAAVLVRRGLSMYDNYKLSYIAYNILGNILQGKDSIDASVDAFKHMATLMKGDTAQVTERKNVMMNVAQLMMSQGEPMEGDAKKAKFTEAATYLQAFLVEFPDDPKAIAALARAQIASGNSAAAEKVFAEMVGHPEKYSDGALFEAGVNAARADRGSDAAGLFAAGLQKNPSSRDGLFNMAVVLQKLDRWDEVPATLNRLIAVDPENPENYQLYALYYQRRAGDVKKKMTAASAAAKAKKTPLTADEKAAAANNDLQFKVANDSLVKYFKRMSEAPVKVTFNLWSHDGTKSSVAGQVENLTDAEKSYTLKFEFLDAAGAVVLSKTASVDAVGGKKSKPFRLDVEGAGIIAFRYAPFGM